MRYDETKASHKKSEAQRLNELEGRATKRRKKSRRCFWTRPFGHSYNSAYTCVACGKWSNLSAYEQVNRQPDGADLYG